MLRLRFIVAFSLALVVVRTSAWGGAVEDCDQDIARVQRDPDRSINGCTELIRKNPRAAAAYNNRGAAFNAKGDLDRAIADYNKAIEIDPKRPKPYTNRGATFNAKGDLDSAIADFNKTIEIDPRSGATYIHRGIAFMAKGDLDRALADFEAARRDPSMMAFARLGLGRVWLRKGDYDRALAELSEAIRVGSKDPEVFAERGAVYEAKGQIDRAIVDYEMAVGLPARMESERTAVRESRVRLLALERQKHAPQPPQPQPSVAAAPTTEALPGRRVALVIGNSAYQTVGRLANPANDARAIAASLRRLGFAEVIESYDMGYAGMVVALRDFGDRAANADWAVLYYAGHGLEMNGIAYVIPVDAKLERDTHVSDETVGLGRIMEKVEGARKLRLVILDACRNNPFIGRMIRTAGGSRSIGRGLAQIEPEGGVLVAYAAKHGTTAEDGAGANSPFAEALLLHLEEPGLEINFLFRKVRDQVLSTTKKRQEPYLYGSLPSESLFFKHALAR